MCEQSKLLAARQHLCTEAGGHAKQANRNRHALQPVGHGKAAVKNFERCTANLAGRRKFDQVACAVDPLGHPTQCLFYLSAVSAGAQ